MQETTAQGAACLPLVEPLQDQLLRPWAALAQLPGKLFLARSGDEQPKWLNQVLQRDSLSKPRENEGRFPAGIPVAAP